MVIENLIGGFGSDDGGSDKSTTSTCPKCKQDSYTSNFQLVDGELILDGLSCDNPRCDN